jgi:hypothetical protein
MKKLINNPILYFILILVGIVMMLSMTSCSPTRGYGCPGQGSGMGFGGYK